MMLNKKRLVVFRVVSQGKLRFEPYELCIRDDAHKVGQALVIYFNMTGGNRDGSYRQFAGVEYDQVFYSESEYYETPFKTEKGIYSYETFRPISVLEADYEKLLKLTQYYGG